MSFRRVLLTAALAGLVSTTAAAAVASYDWLSLCGKCLSPTITSKSGIGTAHAAAEGRITAAAAAAWCENWSMGDNAKSCVREQMASDEAKQIYRASADCPAGRMIAVDGQAYTLAGVWTNDIGAGRAKFRNAQGRIVGQSNADNGLALSQNWEVLCPGPLRPAQPATASAAAPAQRPPAETRPLANPANLPSAGLAAQFSVGQIVEAKYGTGWVRARRQRDPIHADLPGAAIGL